MTDRPLVAAVLTGSHPYDAVGFHRLCSAMPGIDLVPQEIENYLRDWADYRDRYDVVMFFNMHMEIDPLAHSILGAIADPGPGLVILHHALLAWPDSQIWTSVTGLEDRSFEYSLEQTVSIAPTGTTHPISDRLAPFEVQDETYRIAAPLPDSLLLLEARGAMGASPVAWTRSFGSRRVFCYGLGHGPASWDHPAFRDVLARGMRWAAERETRP